MKNSNGEKKCSFSFGNFYFGATIPVYNGIWKRNTNTILSETVIAAVNNLPSISIANSIVLYENRNVEDILELCSLYCR